MSRSEQLLTILRAVLGGFAFVWEVAVDQHQRLWVIVASVWLLGGPLEKFLAFVSSGKLNISVSAKPSDPPRPDDDEDPE
jgi:hypothetical protein